MRHRSLFLFLLLCSFRFAGAQTIQEKLGYPKDTKLLIIHADDMGLSHSENKATFDAFGKGMVNSGSIMVPCPWFPEVATYARAHPDADLGVHLTLTSEWRDYKWRPMLSAREIPSLVDLQGFYYDNWQGLNRPVKPAEIEKELRVQIDRAIQSGIKLTHLDSHMGTLLLKPDYLQIYLKLSREYKLPALLNRDWVKSFGTDLDPYVTEKDIVADQVFIAAPENFKSGLEQYYTQTIQSLQPGLSVIVLHVAYDNLEMRVVTAGQTNWGSAWRQQDFNFFTSPQCRQLLDQEGIKLVTWKEIRDKLMGE